MKYAEVRKEKVASVAVRRNEISQDHKRTSEALESTEIRTDLLIEAESTNAGPDSFPTSALNFLIRVAITHYATNKR